MRNEVDQKLAWDDVIRQMAARTSAGEPLRLDDPMLGAIHEIVATTIQFSASMNSAGDVDRVRDWLSAITDRSIPGNTIIFPPFHTNFGRLISLGYHVFINHGCSFLDMGGITIEDHVMIGPKVSLITENHTLDPADRTALLTAPIVVRKNAWIGAGAIVLPGVTIGENSVVAAGALVNRDVPPNVVVGGIPALVIKTIES